MVKVALIDKKPLSWKDKDNIPRKSGVYAIFLADFSDTPKDWQVGLQKKKGLLYIGQTKEQDGLMGRLKKHFAGTSSSMSAFRRAIGAMLYKQLELKPYYSSDEADHYRFHEEKELSRWIQEYCTYTFCIVESDIKEAEGLLIEKYKPALNDKKNPCPHLLLKDARCECKKIGKNNLNMR